MLPLLTDLRHALRGLRKTPAFALIAISSVALGIGVNVTIYSVAREMILDDLSARRPDRLVRLDGVVTTASSATSAMRGFSNRWHSMPAWATRSGTRADTAKLPGR
jgi:hypothetical protein